MSKTAREFVEVWLEAHKQNKGRGWVAEQLGMRPGHVSTRAWGLRKRGVRLPSLPSNRGKSGGSAPVNPDELNALIDKATREMP